MMGAMNPMLNRSFSQMNRPISPSTVVSGCQPPPSRRARAHPSPRLGAWTRGVPATHNP